MRRSLPLACLRSRTRVNFEGTPAVKTETWSHIPPKYLRRSRRCCLRYNSDIWGNKAAVNKKHRTSLPPARLRSWTWVNFAGMRAVKTDKALVAGDFCSHIGFTFTCCSLFATSTKRNQWFLHASFIHKNCCELFLYAHFLFWEFLNFRLMFVINVTPKSLSFTYTANGKRQIQVKNFSK